MKKTLLSILAAVVLIGVGASLAYWIGERNKVMGGSPTSITNFLNTMTSANTTTATVYPTLLLARNYDRQYARIQNSSQQDVYLYFANATGGAALTTTFYSITNTNNVGGFPLKASSTYEIGPLNLYPGDVWISTNTNASRIYVNYK
jgi:hypothetical protein